MFLSNIQYYLIVNSVTSPEWKKGFTYYSWVFVCAFSFQIPPPSKLQEVHFDFYGDAIDLPLDQATFVDFTDTLSDQTIQTFYDKVSNSHFDQVVKALVTLQAAI